MLKQNKNNNAFSNPEKMPLNLAIVGGGRTCKFFLELLEENGFPFLDIRLVGVCDIDPEAVGFKLAKEMGIYTTDNFTDLLAIKDLSFVIELTMSSEILLELLRLRPKGVGVLEHNVSKLLRHLFDMDQKLKSTEQQAEIDKVISDFLLQHTNERVLLIRPDFVIVDANESYLDAAPKSGNEVIGAHCYEVSHGLNSPCHISQPNLGCPLMETLQTGKSAQSIHEHIIKGGEVTYCDMVTYPVKDLHGEIKMVIEVWRDITEEVSSKLERRSAALKNDLNKLIQEDRMISLGKLVATSVHEINNPIQGLLTFSDLMQGILEEGEPGPDDLKKFQGYLSIMSEELERCGDIVSGLLSFSRESVTEFKDVDINEILEQVIRLTQHRMELQDIRLDTKLSPVPLITRGDVNQLQQCFLNLIFNAIEAMPGGGQLSLEARPDSSREDALITIQDTGLGIGKKNLDHIFDPFFTTKETGEGTGLGLSIVYGVVKAHGGSIKVDSQVGKGTIFSLSFPIQ